MNLKDEHNVYVDSVEEAVALAKLWQDEKKFDYFRGQAQNWDVYAAIHRGKEGVFQKGLERLELLYYFMRKNSILKEYIINMDHFMAVAQHYGLPTNYVDFTTDPNIAAYFATNSIHNVHGEFACIICVNHNDFDEAMNLANPILDKYLSKNSLRPCFLNYEVKNLWRLQAQKGLFLYTPLPGIENLYTFNRILFPFKEGFNALSTEDIYPTAKSFIETHLDDFFTWERKFENLTRIIAYFGEDKIRHTVEENIFDYMSSSCPIHHTWQSKQTVSWQIIKKEDWTKISSEKSLILEFTFSAIQNLKEGELINYVKNEIKKTPNCRNSISKVSVIRYNIPFNKKLEKYIQEGCKLIWNGMRALPYTDCQIASALVRFVIMMTEQLRYNAKNFRPLNNHSLYVRMSTGGYNSATAYVCGYRVLSSKRNGIYNYINDEYREETMNNPIALLQLINNPRYLFRFHDFCDLFAMDVIPSQTVLEIKSKNPVIYYNPKHIKTFGIA